MKEVSESSKFDQLIYVRLVEACNMKCDHCFIPANPKKMTLEQCYSVPDVVRDVSSVGDSVILQWHGGEPTLFGAKRLAKVLTYVRDQVVDRKIINGIQTNLANYDSDWADVYHEFFDSRIGVSWDYNIRHLRDNSDDFDLFFRAQILKLKADGVKYDLTITAAAPFTNWVRSNPSAFFTLLDELKPNSVHIEKITKTGKARDNWSTVGVTNLEYSQLLTTIYAYSKTWLPQNVDWFDGFSPLCDIEQDIVAMASGLPLDLRGCTSGTCDTKFHTIDSNGYKFGCTAINSEVDNTSVVNVVEMITPETLVRIRAGRVADCSDCEFNSICNTGCIASAKVDDSGECSGAYTLRKLILNLNNTRQI